MKNGRIFLYPSERRLTSFAGPAQGHWLKHDIVAAEDGKTARGVVAVRMRRVGRTGTHDFIGN